MLTVFLSYARSDGQEASRRLQNALKDANFSVWLDIDKLIGGQEWKEQLRSALREVDVVIMLLTPAAVESKHVEWEREQALTLEKRLIPLLITRCDLPAELARLHYYDLSASGKYEHGLGLLLRDLRNLEITLHTASPVQPLLHQVWEKLDPELQEIFLTAEEISRREGYTVIKTRHFFSVINRLKPSKLEGFLNSLPLEALPPPYPVEIATTSLTLGEEPILSGCIRGSLNHLSQETMDNMQISTTTMFLDLAKHGTGKSVARLREHGVTPTVIDQLAEKFELEICDR